MKAFTNQIHRHEEPVRSSQYPSVVTGAFCDVGRWSLMNTNICVTAVIHLRKAGYNT